VYRWTSACEGTTLLSPEWFFQNSLSCDDDDDDFHFQVLPLHDNDREYFYLAETMNQMRKCRFIPKYCFEHRSLGISSIASFLQVDPNSVYAERIAMLIGRLVHNAQILMARAGARNSVNLWDIVTASQAFGFHGQLPPHDELFKVFNDRGEHDFLTIFEIGGGQDSQRSSVDYYEETMRQASCYLETLHKDFDLTYARDYVMDSVLETIYVVDVEDEDTDTEEWLASIDAFSVWDEDDDDKQVAHHIRMYGTSPQDLVEVEVPIIHERLRVQHERFCEMSWEDFGVCMARSRLSIDKLKRCVRAVSEKGWSDSAVRFFQLLIEEVHFGAVVEAKVIKEGPTDATWDYGVLLGKNGTILRNLRLSEDEDNLSLMSDVDEDRNDDDFSDPGNSDDEISSDPLQSKTCDL
jgi:hypothetical protein